MNATITINAVTFRHSVLDGLSAKDADAYDEAADGFFERLARVAEQEGMVVVVEHNGSGARSYTVDADDYDDQDAAHRFMQSDAADFWAQA